MKKNLHITKEALGNLYWGQLRSQAAIGKLLGCTGSNVSYLMRRYKIARRTGSEAQKLAGDVGFRKSNKPKLDMSASLAYILGVLKGDGYITQYRTPKKVDSIVGLCVNDLEFAQSFSSALCQIGLNSKIHSYHSQTTKYRVTAYCRRFLEWYKTLSLNAMLKLLEPKPLFFSFFRGLYDSDGCLWQEIDGNQRWGKPRCRLVITNSNQYLLELVQAQMAKYGFSFNLYTHPAVPSLILGCLAEFKEPVSELVLQKREQTQLLLTELQPCIPRKKWQQRREYELQGH